jgi:hypothetical protein
MLRSTCGSDGLQDGPYRFYFFSLEEDRMHIHVEAPDGELKVWLEPPSKWLRIMDSLNVK